VNSDRQRCRRVAGAACRLALDACKKEYSGDRRDRNLIRQPSNGGSAKSALLLEADIGSAGGHVGFVPIVLQKSKIASVRIFGETLKRETIDDSNNLNRVTEVAYEFSVRR
jgi:hypothetical protein